MNKRTHFSEPEIAHVGHGEPGQETSVTQETSPSGLHTMERKFMQILLQWKKLDVDVHLFRTFFRTGRSTRVKLHAVEKTDSIESFLQCTRNEDVRQRVFCTQCIYILEVAFIFCTTCRATRSTGVESGCRAENWIRHPYFALYVEQWMSPRNICIQGRNCLDYFENHSKLLE